MTPAATAKHVICVDNSEYAASLELLKVYRTLVDETAATRGYLRVVDESGEDYLYPAHRFEPVESLPPKAVKLLQGKV